MKQQFLPAILLFVFFSASNVNACVCKTIPYMERIKRSDFIASVEFLELTEFKDQRGVFRAKVAILELFKGGFREELTLQSSMGSSCSFYTPKGSKWLIFARLLDDGKMVYSFCSRNRQLDKEPNGISTKKGIESYNRGTKMQQSVLRYFKANKISPQNKFKLSGYFPNMCLKELSGIKLKGDSEQFGLYEIKVDKELAITEVKQIKGFGLKDIDQSVLTCIEKDFKVVKRSDKSTTGETSFLVCIYYWGPFYEHNSFFGTHIF